MNQPLGVSSTEGTDAEMLDRLRRETFDYFRHEINPQNGYEAAENKTVCNIDHGIRPNARIGGESDG